MLLQLLFQLLEALFVCQPHLLVFLLQLLHLLPSFSSSLFGCACPPA